MNEQLAAGNLAGAVAVFRAARESSQQNHVSRHADRSPKRWIPLFHQLIAALLRTGGPKSDRAAQELFSEMRRVGPAPNAATYEILIARLARSGRQEEAMDAHRRMKGEGVGANKRTYVWLLGLACRNGQQANAQRLFAEMASAGLPLDVDHYNLIIGLKLYGVSKSERQRKVMDILNSSTGSTAKRSQTSATFQTTPTSRRSRSSKVVQVQLDEAEAVLDDMVAANAAPNVR
jgi:pentatricopeptide repeat protein